ncbi:MAG: TatD family hydrolase [Pseudomonadota bacterium]
MFVDSHVNLHGEQYTDDLAEVLARAQVAGVGAMLMISDQLASTDAIREVTSRSAAFRRTVGVHPHHANKHPDLTAQTLIDLAAEPDVAGIGECGLDYHYEYSPRADQQRVFAAHIAASQETGLPLVVHTRNADDDIQAALQEAYAERPFPLLLHCYTSGQALMQAGLELGGYVAFSGIITFKKADDVRERARETPLDRLLIETDCPYLAPVPHRGRRNEPSYVPLVAEKLAEIKDEPIRVIEEATTENYFRLFQRAARP